MNINFSHNLYKQVAINKKEVNYENEFSSEDAFLVLIKGLDYETLENLCTELSKKLSIDDPHIIYTIIKGDPSTIIDDSFKKLVLDTAYDLINSKRFLGNKINSNGFNSSSWIVHCLFEGELASQLAKITGLNPDTAKKIGILHDVGRKFDHSFNHTIKGFEYLYSLGYREEAFCCLTHSFLSAPEDGVLKGNRCANCDQALDGFYIDSEGRGVFEEGTKLDDMTLFLNNYHYNAYDTILNISDLMAESSGIMAPADRVEKIYERRIVIDLRNSPFFQISFVNAMNRLLLSITGDSKYSVTYNIKEFRSLDDIKNLFTRTSKEFFKIYQEKIKNHAKQHGGSTE